MTTTTGLVLDERTTKRITAVTEYVSLMLREREGWGPDAQAEVTETLYSWSRAMSHLMGAARIWADGLSRPLDDRPEFSFGGDLTGTGYYFGVISRIGTSKVRDAEGEPVAMTYPPIEWTFHS